MADFSFGFAPAIRHCGAAAGLGADPRRIWLRLRRAGLPCRAGRRGRQICEGFAAAKHRQRRPRDRSGVATVGIFRRPRARPRQGGAGRRDPAFRRARRRRRDRVVLLRRSRARIGRQELDRPRHRRHPQSARLALRDVRPRRADGATRRRGAALRHHPRFLPREPVPPPSRRGSRLRRIAGARAVALGDRNPDRICDRAGYGGGGRRGAA